MKCNRCGHTEPKTDNMLSDVEVMIDHLRVMHPDDFQEPERWPDGGLVLTVEEESLTPESITDWSAAEEDR